MSTLDSRLHELAQTFASAVLDAIRSASLEELQTNVGVRQGRRAPAVTGAGRAGVAKAERLPRRSAEDIARTLDMVVALVKKEKAGMRAEDIRKTLGLDVREVPRVLKEGIAKKKLRSKGQKRATTYFAR